MRRAIYPVIMQSMINSCCPNQSVQNRDAESDEFVRHFLVIGITQYILEWVESDYKESVNDVIRKLFFIIKKVYE